MIRSLINRWKLDRALAKRRKARKVYRAAAMRGAASSVHKAYERDTLIKAAGLIA